MTNEKLNNDNWKTKLEDASILLEYVLQNKNAAWESLYDKMHKKQQPKSFWYWIAAACLISIFTMIAFMNHSIKNDIVMHASVKPKLQHDNVTQPAAQQPSIQKTNPKHEVAKLKSINPNMNKPIKHFAEESKIAVTDSFVLQHTELNNIKVELPILKDSVLQTTSVALASKKMKIVHVNELNDDGSNINMVQNPVRTPSRIKFLNQDIYTDYTLSAPASGFNILKRKNTQSN